MSSCFHHALLFLFSTYLTCLNIEIHVFLVQLPCLLVSRAWYFCLVSCVTCPLYYFPLLWILITTLGGATAGFTGSVNPLQTSITSSLSTVQESPVCYRIDKNVCVHKIAMKKKVTIFNTYFQCFGIQAEFFHRLIE